MFVAVSLKTKGEDALLPENAASEKEEKERLSDQISEDREGTRPYLSLKAGRTIIKLDTVLLKKGWKNFHLKKYDLSQICFRKRKTGGDNSIV